MIFKFDWSIPLVVTPYVLSNLKSLIESTILLSFMTWGKTSIVNGNAYQITPITTCVCRAAFKGGGGGGGEGGGVAFAPP